jgi:hypothetical protein
MNDVFQQWFSLKKKAKELLVVPFGSLHLILCAKILQT